MERAAELGGRIARTLAGEENVARALYDDAVVYRTPLEALVGRDAVLTAQAEFRRGFPGLRVALRDAFGDAKGQRACLRFRLEWEAGGRFRGREPVGRAGAAVDTHTVRIAGGRVVQYIVGVSTFQLAQRVLVDWGLDFPRGLGDPDPELPVDGDTLAQRFTDAFDSRDLPKLEALYAEDVELYTPLGWPVRGARGCSRSSTSSIRRTRACAWRCMTSSTPRAARAGGCGCTSTTPGRSTVSRPPAIRA